MKRASITVLLALCASPSFSASMEQLQGAWTMNGTDCAQTFKKDGGKIHHLDKSSSLTTGIIISGSEIIGPNATCKVERIRKEKDHFSALMTCSDAIMTGGVSAAFSLIDNDHFKRFDPTFPEISVIYQKCQF